MFYWSCSCAELYKGEREATKGKRQKKSTHNITPALDRNVPLLTAAQCAFDIPIISGLGKWF